jgi:hypothetical protein
MDALGWLLEQGGPVVRYRTAVELAGDKPYGLDLEALEGDLLQDNTVRRRLGNLRPYEEMVERRKRGEGLGVRMGLGEDRRRPVWREVESTFWMLSIRQEMEKTRRGRGDPAPTAVG